MYNVQENVRIVVSLLKEYNISHIVLNPGGTNIPIAQAVQDDPFFHCYSVADERSAMYFAVGLYLQTGEIIATSCTSAQAARNYIPGLTEAYYKHTPIIAITTSKLERYAYQQYMQAPNQTSLPVDAVKKSYDLPPVTDENTRAQCCKLAKEAILEAIHQNPGPIQINIRITDTLNSAFENVALPVIRKVKRYMAWDEWSDASLDGKKIMVVVGEHRPFTERQQIAIDEFSEDYDCVVYTNHLSNHHGKYSINGNLLISVGGMSQPGMKPDVVITIGGQTGDYSIYGTLNSDIGNAEHWRVCEDGLFVDTYCHLTKIFECPFDYFFNRFKRDKLIEHEYYKRWINLESTLNRNIEIPLSNLYAAQQLSPKIPSKSIMNFSILNSLRCWSYFNINPDAICFANVAAFGIDGCNSMLLGESINTDKLCFMITGDLAFFYDMNSLGIRHIKNNIRILLINNTEGAEFGFMTESWKYKPNLHPYISAQGHYGTAKGWVEDCGFEYIKASSKEEFKQLMEKFVSPSEHSIVFEVFTKSEEEVQARNLLIDANKMETTKNVIKETVKKVVGKKRIQMIKNLKRR